MVCRFAAHQFATLTVVLFCSGSLADTPLVIAELDVKQKIAEADSSRTHAEHELAAWKLARLRELRSRGHASWQEVAEQEVTVSSAAAAAEASRRYLGCVLEWQGRLAKLDLPQIRKESECVRLYMPGSARLVAWLPTETASRALSERHRDNLQSEYQSLCDVDSSSLESAVKKAARAVGTYSRSAEDSDLLRRAEQRLRLAEAEYQCAKARKQGAGILARRITLVSELLEQTVGDPPTSSLARPGTRLVDATSDRELSRMVTAMARDETIARAQIAWLKHQRHAVLGRIDALQELSEYRRGDDAELDQAKTEETRLQLQIEQAQEVFQVQQRIAGAYETKLKSRLPSDIEPSKPMAVDDHAFPANASVVRNWLELEQLKLRAAASSAAVNAQRDYLVERLKRVERIPEHARPPMELDHLRHRVQGAQQQSKMIGHRLALLEREQHRFVRQLNSQRGDSFQLVQVDDGRFMPRESFEVGQVLIGAVGFVGYPPLCSRKSILYPYIESTIMLDCLAEPTALAEGLAYATLDSLGPVASLIDSRTRTRYQTDLWSRTDSPLRHGLRLATDRIVYPHDRFCYLPYGMWPVHRDGGWAPYPYLHPASQRGFPTSDAFDREATGLSRLSSFYWRSRCPSFPYRNSYLFQTAFPSRSLLFSNPNILPVSTYQGFRY